MRILAGFALGVLVAAVAGGRLACWFTGHRPVTEVVESGERVLVCARCRAPVE